MPELPTDKRIVAAVFKAIDLLFVPYIWGGNNPEADLGLDCSGFLGYVFRHVGLLPPGYDKTAQGYFDKWAANRVEEPVAGCAAFYGKSPLRITHCMLVVSPRICVGALRGNKWTSTVAEAKRKKARVECKRIEYRGDLIAIVNPFMEV